MASYQKYKTKNGEKWLFKLYTHIDPKTGRKRSTTRRGFKTKKEAQYHARKLENELEVGNQSDSTITFSEFCEQWFHLYQEEKALKPKTINKRYFEVTTLLKHLRDIKLVDVTLDIYLEVLRKLQQKYSDTTVRGFHTTAKMIFKKAMQLEKINKDPTKYSYIPIRKNQVSIEESDNNIPKFMEKEELATFLQYSKSHGMYLDFGIFLTLAYTGLRIGELCALKESDLKEEDGYFLDINKTCYNTSNSIDYLLVKPKTKASNRAIDIDPNVATVLKSIIQENQELRKRYPNKFHNKHFIFTNRHKYLGYPLYPTVIRFRLKRLLKIANLNQSFTLHSFRHTHTSLLAEAEVSLESIMERLGHSSDLITRQIYLHKTKAIRKHDAEKFRMLMDGVVDF